MDKANVFRSNEFHLDDSDVLHVIIKDVTGDGIIIALVDKETGIVEDSKIAVSESNLYDLQDKDGNYYTVITIGTQEWLVENLHTTTYADGTAIPKIENDALWAADTGGAYCWYDNDQATYEATYGALYNFEAVNNEHGLVYFERGGARDLGWRIPTITDWHALYNYISDGVAYAVFNSIGGVLKEVGTSHWTTPNLGAVDTYGFLGLPAGQRTAGGVFNYLNELTWFHSNTEYGVEGSTHFRYYGRLEYADNSLRIDFGSKATGHSVRCMRDITPTMRDFDGNSYTTVIIGTQEWTVENLQTTHYADGVPITAITDNATWAASTSGAYAWYSNDRATYGDTYGALYNWYAVSNAHGLAYFQKNGIKEDGWRIPTKTDFDVLATYLGGINIAGGKLKEEGTTHWLTPNAGAVDTYGFAMLPSGRRFQTGSFSLLTLNGILWTNTPAATGYAYATTMTYDTDNITFSATAPVNLGVVIRCVRDV
jgi:uncharacterized protein (TIGR02145 family)